MPSGIKKHQRDLDPAMMNQLFSYVSKKTSVSPEHEKITDGLIKKYSKPLDDLADDD